MHVICCACRGQAAADAIVGAGRFENPGFLRKPVGIVDGHCYLVGHQPQDRDVVGRECVRFGGLGSRAPRTRSPTIIGRAISE